MHCYAGLILRLKRFLSITSGLNCKYGTLRVRSASGPSPVVGHLASRIICEHAIALCSATDKNTPHVQPTTEGPWASCWYMMSQTRPPSTTSGIGCETSSSMPPTMSIRCRSSSMTCPIISEAEAGAGAGAGILSARSIHAGCSSIDMQQLC